MRLEEIAQRLGARLVGEARREIRGLATLAAARHHQLSFLANSRYRRDLETTRAGAVLLREGDLAAVPEGTTAVVVDDPYLAYARVAEWLHPEPEITPGIHPSAVVDPRAEIHPSAQVGPQCVIEAGAVVGPRTLLGPGCMVGEGVRIGADCRLVARVTLCHGVRLGDRVRLHPGVVIGADGFGLAREGEHWVKIPQLGSVVLGDDCEIGANSTIDRGALDDTVLEEGVKLDNLVQIAHNVRIGAHSVIAAQSGIAGSTHIGRGCVLGGQVGIAGHLRIADGVTLTGKAMVTKSIDRPGVYSSGLPMAENGEWRRQVARIRRLAALEKRVARLEERLDTKD